MELIADILLVAGALGAGTYCFVLSRRLRRFTDLEKGVGGAVSVLSSQADELRKSLDTAREASDDSGVVLRDLTERAETVAQRLELMMASMHDVTPEAPAEPETKVEDPEEPEVEDHEASVEEVETSTSAEAPVPETPTAATDAPAKKPEGLIFFRHARASGGAAQ